MFVCNCVLSNLNSSLICTLSKASKQHPSVEYSTPLIGETKRSNIYPLSLSTKKRILTAPQNGWAFNTHAHISDGTDKLITRVYLVGADYGPWIIETLSENFSLAPSVRTVASHREEKSEVEKRLHCIVDTTDIRSKVCTQIDLNLICSTITTDMIFFPVFYICEDGHCYVDNSSTCFAARNATAFTICHNFLWPLVSPGR